MITAGKPNKVVEDESRSEVTGAGGPEGEVKVWFEDTTCVNMTDFLNNQLQFFFLHKTTSCCLREETSSDRALLGDMLVGRLSECLIALQPHLLQHWHLYVLSPI